MTDDTTDDEPTHRATITEEDHRENFLDKLGSLFPTAEPGKMATRDRIGADSVRTDEWHIPYDEQIEVYVSHDDTEYRVVERDGELALEKTDD